MDLSPPCEQPRSVNQVNLELNGHKSGTPDIVVSSSESSGRKELRENALLVLQFLNEKTGGHYRMVDTNLRLVEARLRSGVDVQTCKSVIAKKVRQWRDDAKMRDYLRPATLFNATKFEQYLGELGAEAQS